MIWILLAAGAGACISIQAAANASFRNNLADPRWAAFFSICGTMLTAAVFIMLVRPAVPSGAAFRSTPWWNWIGGPLGAIIVLSGAALTPRMGAAAFIAAVIGGQVASSLILDHYGLMRLPQLPITASRALGAVLVFIGVLLVTQRK